MVSKRRGLGSLWAGEKWDSVIMDQLGPVGAAMIERLDIASDHRHLDIAAGTGEPGLSIARLTPERWGRYRSQRDELAELDDRLARSERSRARRRRPDAGAS